jgi:branched-chain amino acid aminotransferase
MDSLMTKFSKGAAYVEGRMVPIAEAKISLLDWGFLHSDATYDVAGVLKGKFFRLDDHIDRFFASMEKLHMSIPRNRSAVQAILIDCVKKCGLQDAYVEMICTRGLPEPGSRDPRTCKNKFFAFAIPFVWIAPLEKQKEGLHLIVSHRQRIPPESVDPTVKNYHWLDMVMGLFEAYERGGETAIVVDSKGNLVEGPGFNIFAVNGQTLTTPGRGVLEGMTRRTTIEMAPECGFEVLQQNLPASAALAADEVFITTTAGGIIPITKIDGNVIGTGAPGPATEALQKRYWQLHEDQRYTLRIDYS